MGQAARYPCGHCGTLNNAGDQFCANCGYLLSSGPTGTVPVVSNAPTIASTATPPAIAAVRRVTGELAVGTLLGGRYRNLGLVGQGGFGVVYKASDERFKSRRTVAIKEMSDANLTPTEKIRALDDFRQEADLLVGQPAIEYPLTKAAPDPARRRIRARSRRLLRLPFHTKGVGFRFHPSTVCSNQSMISWALVGCCPARARGTMMRCTDSAILSQEPPTGV